MVAKQSGTISKGVNMNRFAPNLLLLACLFMVGCRESTPPVNTDDAGTHLKTALEAWKAKQEYGSLQQQTPAIVFNEPLWRDGVILLDYTLGDVELHGRQGRCSVKVSLQQKDGTKTERKIGYQIDTIPAIVIVREGLGA
jgi:hypothetical protein